MIQGEGKGGDLLLLLDLASHSLGLVPALQIFALLDDGFQKMCQPRIRRLQVSGKTSFFTLNMIKSIYPHYHRSAWSDQRRSLGSLGTCTNPHLAEKERKPPRDEGGKDANLKLTNLTNKQTGQINKRTKGHKEQKAEKMAFGIFR